MARIRDLKPSFFRNEQLAELPHWVRLLFQGLWGLADRDGRLEDRPKRVGADVFPYEQLPIDDGLTQLSAAGFIQRYRVGELRVIQITNFTKHQKPHPKEAPSELPAFNQSDTKEPGKGAVEPRKEAVEPGKSSEGSVGALALGSAFPSGSSGPSGNGIAGGVAQSAPPPADPEFIRLPLKGTGEAAISERDVAEWETTFTAVNVRQKLRYMRQWLAENPGRRSASSRGARQRIVAWLTRDHDKAVQSADARAGPPANGDRAMSRVNRLEELKRGLVADGNLDGPAKAIALAPGE